MIMYLIILISHPSSETVPVPRFDMTYYCLDLILGGRALSPLSKKSGQFIISATCQYFAVCPSATTSVDFIFLRKFTLRNCGQQQSRRNIGHLLTAARSATALHGGRLYYSW